jgi:hypothetical protein
MINIQFDIPVTLSVDNQDNLVFKSSLIPDFNATMLKNSRLNSVDEIISYQLGPIQLLSYETKIKETNVLTIKYQVLIIGNHSLNLETVEEIIYSILPSAYEEDTSITFLKDGLLRSKQIKVRFPSEPKNILYS